MRCLLLLPIPGGSDLRAPDSSSKVWDVPASAGDVSLTILADESCYHMGVAIRTPRTSTMSSGWLPYMKAKDGIVAYDQLFLVSRPSNLNVRDQYQHSCIRRHSCNRMNSCLCSLVWFGAVTIGMKLGRWYGI